MELKKIRKNYRLTRKEVEEHTGIPLRTLTNWENGVRACSGYMERFLCREYQMWKYGPVWKEETLRLVCGQYCRYPGMCDVLKLQKTYCAGCEVKQQLEKILREVPECTGERED